MTKARRLDDLWSHIHCLAILARSGTFTAAASRLHISKASVSQRIAELEAAAGIPLVRRTTRSVRLTEAGQRLVDGTADAFGRIEQIFTGVKDLSEHPRGVLSLTAPVAFGRQIIAPLIPKFLARHPEVQIQMELSDRLASLANEGFDVAIRHVSEVPETHVASILCETRSVLVATPEYLGKHGTPEHPSDLRRHSCLHYFRRSESVSWTFEREGAVTEEFIVAVRGNFAANNSEVLRQAALGDLGIALLPDFSARSELQAGALVPVLPQWRIVGGFADRLYLVRPYTTHVPRTVTAFTVFLREALSSGIAPSH
ncbi:DNA-binding transcriptional regulator, LysR family [Variovorax sp. HW608]|uniref:LysR family transcriptional regulator n=1 Tax=Variovorax sp. HW608 TaxID=1034889 RepID=UPI0008201EA4|nr:LysR family transcriptional regulator [Variovorax sp. HW608]SCK18739.1 DNA-binding transcriptional regulator, LysR family [Variovorax sp. HW608]